MILSHDYDLVSYNFDFLCHNYGLLKHVFYSYVMEMGFHIYICV